MRNLMQHLVRKSLFILFVLAIFSLNITSVFAANKVLDGLFTIVTSQSSSNDSGDQQYNEDFPEMIPVLEYHNIGIEESRWTRLHSNLYDDLLWLYNNDFRPVTVEQFLTMQFPLEEGKKPFLLTFDDASPTQFNYLEDGTIDPLSAVGVLDRFAQDYPDFGSTATFFALPYSFGDSATSEQKLKYLIQTGREIQNHTYGHDDLSTLGAEAIQETLANNQKYFQDIFGENYRTTSLGYPLGHFPDGDLLELIKSGSFDGHNYNLNAAFLVGAEPSIMPNNPDFDAYKIPRIQTIDDEWRRWFNREPGEVEKSDELLAYKQFVVTKEFQSFEVEKFEIVEDSNVEQEDPQEEEIPPQYPYMSCKEFDFEPMSFGENLIKKIEYQASRVQLNPTPDELIYKNNAYYYTIQEEYESIAEKFVQYSEYYRAKDFYHAIVAANPNTFFEVDDEILIPDIPKFLVKKTVDVKDPRGIYLSGYYAASDEGKRLVEELLANNGNMIVFDVKEIDGFVFYPTQAKLAKETGANDRLTLPYIENFIRYWHNKGVYLSARIVVFKDIHLANARPDLAIHNQQGGLWANREGVVWLDPSNKESQDYILTLVEELAEMGIDEVQFDYIRFPTLGDVGNAKYNFDEENMEKYEVIRGFLARVYDRLRPYDTKFSVDIYGVVVWNDGYDAIFTGQKMECLGNYIDVVYPMTYPSHFGPGFGGYASPADHPYYFVHESVKLFAEALEGTNTRIRPWLQAFSWRVSNYGVWYIEDQIRAINDNGFNEYTLWNASNYYDNVWEVFNEN